MRLGRSRNGVLAIVGPDLGRRVCRDPRPGGSTTTLTIDLDDDVVRRGGARGHECSASRSTRRRRESRRRASRTVQRTASVGTCAASGKLWLDRRARPGDRSPVVGDHARRAGRELCGCSSRTQWQARDLRLRSGIGRGGRRRPAPVGARSQLPATLRATRRATPSTAGAARRSNAASVRRPI